MIVPVAELTFKGNMSIAGDTEVNLVLYLSVFLLFAATTLL